MKALCLITGLTLFISAASYASCEDGQSMAEDAAVKTASKRARKCSADSESSTIIQNSGNTEIWSIAVRCSSFIGRTIYQVKLVELEDAICRVKKVTVLSTEE